jgi:hypothetical protein
LNIPPTTADDLNKRSILVEIVGVLLLLIRLLP